jgi:hypothetical protein
MEIWLAVVILLMATDAYVRKATERTFKYELSRIRAIAVVAR